MKTVKDLYKDFRNGIPLTNGDTIVLSNHLKTVAIKCFELGPEFAITARAANDDHRRLEDIKRERKI